MHNRYIRNEAAELMEEDTFTVKEFVAMDYLLGCFFLFLFFCATGSGFTLFTVFTIIGTAGFFFRGWQNQERLRIDCNGIYMNRKLVTTWENFLEADILPDRSKPQAMEEYVLVFRYFKEGIEGSFRMIVPLVKTQDKSEVEVLNAVRRFYGLWKQPVTMLKQPKQIGNGAA